MHQTESLEHIGATKRQLSDTGEIVITAAFIIFVHLAHHFQFLKANPMPLDKGFADGGFGQLHLAGDVMIEQVQVEFF